MQKKLSREQAEAEITAWLDKKKIFDETREKYKDNTEVLVEAMMNGVLTLNPETFEFKHDLLFPIGENNTVTSITYVPRINDRMIQPYMKGVKSDDVDARLVALIGAITKEAKGVIMSMDSVDKRIATAIGIFFM
jgi:hypothetical protein